MSDSLIYKMSSGKPSKLLFFMKGFLKQCIPGCYYRNKRKKLLKTLDLRADKEYILDRVAYYNKVTNSQRLPSEVVQDHKGSYFVFLDKMKNFGPSTFHKAYFFDLYDVARFFNRERRISFIPGDVYFTPPYPTIVKSRLLKEDNHNSVVLKLDKLRHFMFVNDGKSFTEKKDMAIFRGKIRLSRQREQFLEMYFDSPLCDCGVVDKVCKNPAWKTPKKTIKQHLDYKFIMALEGNDVASNLKWVMSSNSIAVMPRPTCETWFMEGKLVPNYHYIEIKNDLSDLEERLTYYINHPDEAQQIINHAHEYVAQFMDEEREEFIQMLVMDKYLSNIEE